MNNSKLSNTGMLKIASKWVQLLRAGKLSTKDLNRISAHAGKGLRNIESIDSLERALPSFLQGNLGPTGVRAGLRNLPRQLNTRQLRDEISRSYYSTHNDVKNIGDLRNLNKYNNYINENFIKNEKKEFLDLLRQKSLNYPNKKLLGFTTDSVDSGFHPLFNTVFINKSNIKDIPFIKRHEIAHGMHATAPKHYARDVILQTQRMIRQFPHTRKILNPSGESLMDEATAQFIGSKGSSNSARKFVQQSLSHHNPKVLKENLVAPTNSLISDSLKLDPSGRIGSALSQLHRNYNLDLPYKYTNPGYFNPNPYLP